MEHEHGTEKAPSRAIDRIVGVLLTALSAMLVYSAAFGQFSVMVQRGVPLALTLVCIFLLDPLRARAEGRRLGRVAALVDWLLIAGTVGSVGYVVVLYDSLAGRMGITTTEDMVAAGVGLACLLEATRRTTGNALVLISAVFLVYAFVGPYMPDALYHEGFGIERLARVQWTGLTGVFGTILSAMVTIIFVFILLAEFLRVTRAGDYVIQLALALTGRMRGGPALSSIVSSMMFGMVSGSPVANVMGVGTFTIPLMQRYGFSGKIAAAVEAAASAGGYLMPPVMGAGAFIMAELTGIPYLQIALVALIPSVLYYGSMFLGVYIYSAKIGARAMPTSELPSARQTFIDGCHTFLIIPVLIGSLIAGYTPGRACVFALAALLLLCAIRPSTRFTLSLVVKALRDGAENTLGITAACASMGIIIGCIDLTGLGTSISLMIELLAGQSLFLCLLLVMLASVVIGMGVAPVATYVMLIIILGPVLETLGLPVLVAHFFVLYYSTYAVITPPVALAAYAGAGIAKADPFQTGLEAFKLGLPGFLLPFLFAYYPGILLAGGTWEFVMAVGVALMMMWPLNVANYGYLFGPAPAWGRGLLLVAVFLMFFAAVSLYAFGVSVFLIGLVCWWQYHRAGRPSTTFVTS